MLSNAKKNTRFNELKSLSTSNQVSKSFETFKILLGDSNLSDTEYKKLIQHTSKNNSGAACRKIMKKYEITIKQKIILLFDILSNVIIENINEYYNELSKLIVLNKDNYKSLSICNDEYLDINYIEKIYKKFNSPNSYIVDVLFEDDCEFFGNVLNKYNYSEFVLFEDCYVSLLFVTTIADPGQMLNYMFKNKIKLSEKALCWKSSTDEFKDQSILYRFQHPYVRSNRKWFYDNYRKELEYLFGKHHFDDIINKTADLNDNPNTLLWRFKVDPLSKIKPIPKIMKIQINNSWVEITKENWQILQPKINDVKLM